MNEGSGVIYHNLSKFTIKENSGVYIYPSDTSIKYADGGEGYISETLRNAKDISSYSPELIKYIRDWPSRYHLTFKRNNLLEGITELLDKNSSVLEIGSGCGSITRWLGERFKNVDAVEGNFSRASITRQRTSGFDNVNVYCDDIQCVSFDKKYDIITLIGVLEYMPFYDKSSSTPAESCINLLSKLSGSLDDQGILVLAIENKLGLKYFSGCSEDHTAKPFDGLCGYPEKTPVTFSRQELEEILKRSGFKNIQFYHLFPDYKLTDILIQENEDTLSLRPYNWIKTPFEDYSGDRLYLLPEQLLLKTYTESKLLWHTSNSFLVLASKSSSVNLKTDWLIKKFYNNENHDKRFYHEITLEKSDGPGHIVKKKPIDDGLRRIELPDIVYNLEDLDYFNGDLLSLELLRAVMKNDCKTSIESIIRMMHEHLIRDYSTGKKDEQGYPLVTGDTIDYTLWNIIVLQNKELQFIDKKWRMKKNIPVDFVLFRSLYYVYNMVQPFLSEKDMAYFIISLIKSIYPQYDMQRATYELMLEEQFQSAICNKKVDLSFNCTIKYSIVQQAKRARESELDSEKIAYLNKVISENEKVIAKLNTNNNIANGRINSLEKELGDIKGSTVWRLVMAYHNNFVEKLMPHETLHRRIYDRILKSSRFLINEVLIGLLHNFRHKNKDKSTPTINPKFVRTIQNPVMLNWRSLPILNTPMISIVIVTYNSGGIIGGAIESIVNQGYPLNSLELIIVDNGSRDETTDIVKQNIDKYRDKLHISLIDTKKNNGFGKGVNIGIRNASDDAEFILLVNPDCVLYNDTIKELALAASSTMEYGYRLWECRQMPYEHPKHYSPVTLETSWSSGACCLIHKKTFDELGGFDENIFLYMEDVDLSWRLRMNGYKLMYLPFARVQHDTYSDANVVKSAQYYNSVLYQFYLRYKYGNQEEIKWYYKEYWRLVKNAPNKLPHERYILIEQFAKHCLLIPKALTFRRKNGEALKLFKPWFMDYDFEFRREGAFVKSDIDMQGPELLPKVSIIVRTIGRKGFLREALTSIRNQTYGNIETIVVEDGPATVKEMLDSEFSGMDIKYFALGERHGRCKAGNFGLSRCCGKYLRFLDEDDLLYATSVETAVYSILKDSGEHKLVYDLSFEVPTEVLSEDPLKYVEQDYKLAYNVEFNRKIILNHNFIPIQDVLFDKGLYEKYGGFDENLDALEDWDLWIRYSQHTEFLRIPKVTSLYRVPALKADNEKRQVKLDEYYQMVRKKHTALIGIYN